MVLCQARPQATTVPSHRYSVHRPTVPRSGRTSTYHQVRRRTRRRARIEIRSLSPLAGSSPPAASSCGSQQPWYLIDPNTAFHGCKLRALFRRVHHTRTKPRGALPQTSGMIGLEGDRTWSCCLRAKQIEAPRRRIQPLADTVAAAPTRHTGPSKASPLP